MVGGEIPWWRDDRIPLRRWHLSQHIGSVQEQELILNRSDLPHDLASKQLERLLICAKHIDMIWEKTGIHVGHANTRCILGERRNSRRDM